MFFDRVKLKIAAGKGGNGVVAWTRGKYLPKGGPCGGDGGKGGDVIIKANTQIPCLDWYRNRRILKAENGAQGGPNCRKGRSGKKLLLEVPCGTLIKDIATGEILHDFTQDGEEWIICKGGKGGRGNDAFKTPTNRAPNYCTPGKEGEETHVELELKLIADVGLVGFPNAGKSTLINALTDVPVKIAAYPFTTLKPNIGFIRCEDEKRIFIADIPGIIAGASQDRGLGFEFLRHIERTTLLLFLLDCSGIDGRNPTDDLQVLLKEVKEYNPELLKRDFIVALNKMDSEEAEEHAARFRKEYPFTKNTLFELSALTGEGIAKLQKAIEKKILPTK